VGRVWLTALGGALALGVAARFAVGDPSLETYPVRGIDVSHHQGEIDWARVAGEGVRFAYLKATEGRDLTDRRFAVNWQAAAAHGVRRGAYHFFTLCSSGAEQAEHFLAVAPPDPDALRPVVDVEFVGNCTKWGDLERVRRDLAAFLAPVERAWGRQPILYVTSDSHARVLAGRFAAHAIWIRSVLREPPPEAYGGWLIWQYSDRGRVAGMAGTVDRNGLRRGARLRGLE